MKSKIALPGFVIGASALCVALVFAGSAQETTHAALKQDLVSASGEKVVEITEASYRLSENILKDGSCRVRNLSGRNVTGMGLTWTVVLANGEQHRMQKLIDYRLEKDVADLLGSRPFSPFEEKVITYVERDPHIQEQPIEKIKVEVAFVVFDDANGVGIDDSGMYQRLLRRREGAELYKKWLEDVYGDDPKKMSRVIQSLSGDEMPVDKKLEDDGVEAGATVCKQWVLGLYREKGEDFLRQLLKRK